MKNQKTKIGIIGCGNISGIYLKMAKQFEILEVAACADLIVDRAKAKATEYGVAKACSVKELLADPEIKIVVNLTIPIAHAEVAMQALEAGKSVYNEKPLTITREDSQKILQLAKKKGLRVGGAPDTFMGAGFQTCRKAIDDGMIGKPIAALAFMLCRGHEGWHPDPDFYYQAGGGPMFDMGPYYLTALVSLMGPVQRVTGSAKISFPERTITSQPKAGTKIKVNTPTHIAGVMDFAGGCVGTIITSFDVYNSKKDLPRIMIYGTEGTLNVPDPNGFGGPVILLQPGKDWTELPLMHKYGENFRSLGVADMASAIRSGRAHRANGELAYHVLDIMHAFHDSSRDGKHVNLASTCARPAPLNADLPQGVLDD